MSTSHTFSSLLRSVGLTTATLAEQIGVQRQQVWRWCRNEQPAPLEIVGWLSGLAEYRERNPPPPQDTWTRRW